MRNGVPGNSGSSSGTTLAAPTVQERRESLLPLNPFQIRHTVIPDKALCVSAFDRCISMLCKSQSDRPPLALFLVNGRAGLQREVVRIKPNNSQNPSMLRETPVNHMLQTCDSPKPPIFILLRMQITDFHKYVNEHDNTPFRQKRIKRPHHPDLTHKHQCDVLFCVSS